MWLQRMIVKVVLVLGACESGGEDDLGEGGRAAEVADTEIEANESKPKHCKVVDSWEANPSAEQPTVMPWQVVAPDFVLSHTVLAYLCAGEEDWYSFETSNLQYQVPWLQIFAEVESPNLCTALCGDPSVKPGPKHAITVEVYRADTMQLLASGSSSDGEVFIQQPGDYLHDLLIRVHSTTAKAKYSYRLWVLVAEGTENLPPCEC